MANVVWANQVGSWTNTAIWSYWDELTQSIQLYGQVPQVNDVVYANGYDVTIDTQNITIDSIRNTINPYTTNSGGCFRTQTATITHINGDVYAYETYCISVIGGTVYNTDNTRLYINGNLYASRNSTNILAPNGNARIWIQINGNVNGRLFFYSQGAGSVSNTLEIVGNINCDVFSLLSGPNSSYSRALGLSITGNITLSNGAMIADGTRNVVTTITGNVKLIGNSTLNCNTQNYAYTMKINGAIDVTQSAYGVIFTTTLLTLSTTTGISIIKDGDYPTENNVKYGVPYDKGRLVGTFQPDYPPESVVLDGFEYGENMTGTMTQSVQVGCVTKEDVREGVPLIGMYEDEQQVVGTIIIPAEEDVREGVHYDNDKIGTLIVQGGGDRLRIADFGYYTNAQSDTYIVDITEADKPKFASAEERILIEMFPTLDLDNIPQMYFDDLFVKYLKYRLIVEYYRTAGVNSTFTPSEPTTEIVNYRNVTCEVWLNSANTYLNAWNKKFGLNKPPKKVRL